MDYPSLQAELTNDPVGMVYTGKDDAAVAALLNDATKRTMPRTIIPSYEVIEATVAAEWTALTTAEKQRYQTLTGAGSVNVQGTNTRAAFAAMFGAGTATRTALLALATQQASRAAELGLGTVTAVDVARARGGTW